MSFLFPPDSIMKKKRKKLNRYFWKNQKQKEKTRYNEIYRKGIYVFKKNLKKLGILLKWMRKWRLYDCIG
jgi:hypothetical protein